MFKRTSVLRLKSCLVAPALASFLVSLPLAGVSWAAHISTSASAKAKTQHKISETQHTRHRLHHLAHARAHRATVTAVASTTHSGAALRHHRYYERFSASSFADDITSGDITTGEDPIVRQAAIDALGNMNGTVVAIEPTSGRVLAMVNQKL